MGGSGGIGFRAFPPDEIRSWITDAQDTTAATEHNNRINAYLADLLAQYNDRDVALTREHLNEIERALEDELETTLDLRFGGSIAKHTFVDGISDVDALAILRDPELSSLTAREVLGNFGDTLRRELGFTVDVSVGRLAVTISFPDGMEIQILPAIQTATGYRIPSGESEEWSSVIRPRRFVSQLTETNQACGQNLVPTIKLAKSVLSDQPDGLRPIGYHVEALAVEAFKHYEGPNNPKAMLHHFFERGGQLVLSPIIDSTGQSLNVDTNLGEPHSYSRQLLSSAMDRIARRMSNADSVCSLGDWLRAIGEQY